ncbi:MAG: hypothetical protein P4L84_24065 [Isosphaeraceae bacterium]|nr:hypothetical protein [Isosphaeraceae bacterium]
MSDHPDEFGPDEPSPLPEGEFKSNFFETVGSAEPAPAEPDTLASLPPAPPEAPIGHPVFPIVIGTGFLLAIVAGAVTSAWPVPTPPETAAAAAAAPAAEAPAKEADLKSLAESLKTEIASLSKQVKDLDGRLAELPKPTPTPDLAPLKSEVAALSKSIDAVTPLSKKVDALDQRLGGLDKSVKSLQDGTSSLKDQVASLRTDLTKPGAPVASADATTRDSAKPVNVNVEGQSFAQAADLFKAGKYKEASDVLKTTEDNDPKDARVWYYAALSKGLATGEWAGNTQTLVMKGVEREKAGTPSTSEIDSEFAKLPAAVKTWLDAYRKLALK